MTKAPKRHPFVSTMLQELAQQVGVEILVEPEFGYAGQIKCPNGKLHYFRKTHFDLNPLGATEVAKDKDYATFFLRKLGYPVIAGQKFYSEDHCRNIGSKRNIHAGARYAARHFPVIVKPNSRSLGMAVSAVHSAVEYYQAAADAFDKDRVILIQKIVTGKDYRLVVLDDEVLSAYERLPLTVVGREGRTIRALLLDKQSAFRKAGRDTELDLEDPRMVRRLARLGIALDTVLEPKERVVLLDNANLSSGGESVDVTSDIHPGYKAIAVGLTRDIGLRYAGIDLMVKGDITKKPGRYTVIEINASPGIDNYAAGGEQHMEVVANLYRKVLEAIRDL